MQGPESSPADGREVLIVDDDRDLLALMAIILEEAGFTIGTARNGREALEHVAAHMPGLVLLDMNMPVMNGAEFLVEFRRLHARPAPVVLVTAADDAARRAEALHAEGFLGKPFDPVALIETVRSWVGA